MQNAFGKLPFKLASGAEQGGLTAVSAIYWYNPSAANDTFIVTDGSGSTVFKDICVTAHGSKLYDFSNRPIEVNNLGIGQLSSGEIWIYPA